MSSSKIENIRIQSDVKYYLNCDQSLVKLLQILSENFCLYDNFIKWKICVVVFNFHIEIVLLLKIECFRKILSREELKIFLISTPI